MCRKCEGTGGDATSPSVTSRGNDAAPAPGRRATGQITLRAYAKATSLIFVRAKVRAFAAPRCACCNLRLVFSLAGIFRYLKECSSTSDAECTCKEGYHCGGDGCTFCTRSCGVGQESTGNGCRTCRYGTFNDQPNGSCKNWTKCSGNQVLEPGTPAKDVICKHASVNPTLVTTLPTTSLEIPVSITVPGNDVQTDMIRISLAVAGLSCIVFLLPLCICFSVWQKKKLHTVFKKMHTPEQSIQEDDACSCHFPEEEQGEYQDRGKSTEFRDLLVN